MCEVEYGGAMRGGAVVRVKEVGQIENEAGTARSEVVIDTKERTVRQVLDSIRRSAQAIA